MSPTGRIVWDIDRLSAAMNIGPDRLSVWFKDGRRAAWFLEEIIATRHGMSRLGECARFDLKDPNGGHWEVRGCTKAGLFFCQSSMVGKGRKFDIIEYLSKQADVAGWIVGDITRFPDVPYWMIPKSVIEDWWGTGKLGMSTKLGRKRFRKLVEAADWPAVTFPLV